MTNNTNSTNNQISFLKVIFGDCLIAKSIICKTARKLVKELNISLSKAMRKAWDQARKWSERVSKFVIVIHNKKFDLDCELEDVIELGIEKIGEVTGNKKFMYNVSNRMYAQYEKLTELLSNRGSLTFAQDIYVRMVKLITKFS